jgi:hypothetical protein
MVVEALFIQQLVDQQLEETSIPGAVQLAFPETLLQQFIKATAAPAVLLYLVAVVLVVLMAEVLVAAVVVMAVAVAVLAQTGLTLLWVVAVVAVIRKS